MKSKVCPYGKEIWIDANNKDRHSDEYQKNYFKAVICCREDDFCKFPKDYDNCSLYEKIESD